MSRLGLRGCSKRPRLGMIVAMLRVGLLAVVVGLVAGCSKDPRAVSTGKGTTGGAGVVVAPEDLMRSEPLPNRAVVAGKRFVRLDPGTTGLSFKNVLRPENTVAYVYMGAGLTVGDFDQDGLPDVYLVSQDGQNKLFRQTAPLKFEDVTGKAGAGLGGGDAWGTAATFADVDGDGDLDLYVCNLESPNLLFQNQGDGTFVEKAGLFGLGQIAASTGAAFADYDNDGDLDLYLLTNRVFRPTLAKEIAAEAKLPGRIRKKLDELLAPELTFEVDGHRFMAGQQDRLFRNDGYAQFVDVTAESGLKDAGNGLSVVWWDFDNDGRQDLYVANDFQSPDQLYRNMGSGMFRDVTEERLPHTAFFGMGTDFGDINNDGRFDLCVADMSSTSHYMGKMLMGNMDQHRWFLMNSKPQQYMRNALYVNTGTERFLEAAHMAGLASTDWTWTVRFADFDEDGRLDFYATNGIPVFADNPDTGARVTKLWGQRRYQAALDVMRNMPRIDEKNIARRNVGDLQFEDIGAEWGLDESGVTHGAVVVDLDRDGDLDVITNNLNAAASVFENRTADTNRLLVELRGHDGNHFGVGARIEVEAGGVKHVRQVSLTRGYMSAGEAVEHFGLGAATKVDKLHVIWPSGRRQPFVGVVANQWLTLHEDVAISVPKPPVLVDGEPVLALDRIADELIPMGFGHHQEREFDDFAAQPLLPHRLSRLGPGLAVGSIADDSVQVWLGGAAGQAGHSAYASLPADGPWLADAEAEDMGAVFLDFDSDGDLDLYVASGGIEVGDDDSVLRNRLYVSDGRGGFARAPDGTLPDLRISSSCVAAADYDRDGDVDLFVGGRVIPGRYPHAPTSTLLRNDSGKFVDVTDEVAPACRTLGMVSSACWTDLDGDGFVDLVVAAQWQPVRVLVNVKGQRLQDRTDALGLGGVHGLWNGVTSSDLDGDGDFDLVVTNLGLNTKYTASAKKPMQLFAQDFDGNGTMDVIEAKQSGGVVLPVRGLSCSGGAMPFVREKFSTYDAFARASLGDIYGAALDECLTLTCHELRHVIFENRGGAFVMHALPRAAQISASFGVLARDTDGDGVPELVLSHNFWSPEPETGRIDGGLGVLLRRTDGWNYEAVSPSDSGIMNPFDSRGVMLLDMPSATEGAFILFAGNDCSHVGVSYPVQSKARLVVRLSGPAGNPNGIGAKVTLRRDGEAPIVRELIAGDGYLTQSSPVLWFPETATGVLHVDWPDGGETEQVLTKLSGRVTLRR
ncbi:MAG: hypothetical protein ACI9SE_000912 [Neolewinella sp.]|jgi:hypothetical protein